MHKGIGWLRRYWMYLAAIAVLVLAFGVSASALAAPPSSLKYQTVPKPTPTSEGGDSVATATPRPDNDDDDDDGGGSNVGGGTSSVQTDEREVPVFVIEEGGGSASGLTASVTVATLNVREEPGTSFPIVGSLSDGDVVDVIWRNQGSTWFYVCCIPGTELGGWVSAQLLTLNFNRAAAAELVPLYAADAALGAAASDAPAAGQQAVSAATAPGKAALPVELDVTLSPPYLAQGQTGLLLLSVTNPNAEDVIGIEASDQLPPELALIDATASGDGVIDEQTSTDSATVILASWDSIPAGTNVQLSLAVRVDGDLPNGAVFDNLAAIQGENTAYTTGSITIGMPPAMLPDFQ
jgi:hypothetical protein